MLSERKVSLNGAFLQREFTAVGFVGEQYLRALSKLSDTEEFKLAISEFEVCLLDRPHNEIADVNFPTRKFGSLPRIIWQQFAFPQKSKGNLLLSLCNIGPAFAKNAITLIHDAHVLESPESYSRAFVEYSKFAYKNAGRNHQKIITISDYSANALIKHNIVSKDRISVIPNGIDHVFSTSADPSILQELNLSKNGFVLGLANSQKHKNTQVLLDAFRENSDIHLPLVLFGKEDRESFIDAGLNPSENVIFTGKVSDASRRALYENAMCFAFPSILEGFGFPPAEAMALGCPTIAAPCTAVPEICEDKAIYAAPDSPLEWADAIKSLRDNANLRSQMSKASIEHLKKYTWENAAKSLLKEIANLPS